MAFRVFASIQLISLMQALPIQAQLKSASEETVSSALILESKQIISSSFSFSDRDDSTGGTRITYMLKEAGMGALMGVLFSFPSGLIANRVSKGEGLGGYGSTVIGMYVGYVIGTSFGVYIGSDEENQHASFLRLLASGVLGAGIAIGIKNVMNLKSYGTVVVILFPIAFPISYVELLE